MKLLLDTNILLDCMISRRPFAADARICAWEGECDIESALVR